MAQNSTKPEVHNPRIVLGLDYGTTYTGLAWIQTTGQDSPSLNNLTVFRNWPEKNAQKVPSEYSYSRTSNVRPCKQWGYSISDDSQVMRWTKLELEPRTTVRELEVLRELVKGLDLVSELRTNENAANTNDIPRQISKDSGDIVMDYLREVAKEWFLYIRSQGRHTLDNVSLDIVVTHPASWSYEAINKTFRAVAGAFHRGMFPRLRGISLTSEPEACALYTVQDMLMKDHITLIPGECFILCDAGGGTVDVVSYRIESIEPLKLTKVGGISGKKCGATFIDHAFLEWLRPRLQNQDLLPKDFLTGGHFVVTSVVRVVLERFERVKHAFDGTQPGDFSLPRGAIVAEGQEDGLQSGVISLTETEIRSMFERSVRGAVSLISRQVTQVENEVDGEPPRQVTNVFLSGGFSENEYLFKEVKKYTDSTGHIHLQRADDCWSGVVKGAVLRGMGIGMDVTAQAKPCPRHYGICVSQIYAAWGHNSGQVVTDRFHGRQVVPDQLIWLVRKGDVILPDEPIVSTIDVGCRFASRHLDSSVTKRITFVASRIENPPSTLSNLPRGQNQIADLEIDLRLIPETSLQPWVRPDGGSPYYTAVINVKFQVSSCVKVELECSGMMLGNYDTTL